ncbi:MAG: hypothetical protein GY729_01255 [Desulfobacteraceae bacterium]|nr:hypothetical protein [Desulfobacteraceae bacterium]
MWVNSIENITLMGPGPSCVDPSVLDALSKSTLGHMENHLALVQGLKAML